MLRPTRPSLRASLLFAFTLTVAPACTATANDGPRVGLGTRIANRFAYRPVYPEPNPLPRGRPLYLSGYAGAAYGPRRPVGTLTPTGVVVPSRPVPYWAPTAPGLRGLLGLEPDSFRP